MGSPADANATANATANANANASANATSRSKWYEGIAGLGPDFTLFTAPSWVDTAQPPGHTSQSSSLANNPHWRSLLTGMYIIYSPNLVWLVIALTVYFVFSYDYDVARNWDAEYGKWIAKRALLNVSLVYLYYGFWHSVLYFFGWSVRPFNADRGLYRWSKLLHNVWYTTLGALQWTCWEAIMVHCYATGRMPYLSDEEAWASPFYGISHFVAWSVLVPLFREIHFYFAHRLIHTRALYTYVHSIHHRNTDVEPFSGLCMHPIEHLYYFTSVAPSLYFYATPFAFLWNGIHLILSPGASHSGYEDHWQSDQHHYIHHRYFECNYGTPCFVLDNIFGTFRDRLAAKSDTYKGDADGVGTKTAAALDSKATLLGWPDWDQILFNIAFCFGIPILYTRTLCRSDSGEEGSLWFRRLLPAMLVVGPMVGGIFIMLLKSLLVGKSKAARSSNSFKRQLAYPFHREAWTKLSMHLIIGFLLGVFPAYTLFRKALFDPGDRAPSIFPYME